MLLFVFLESPELRLAAVPFFLPGVLGISLENRIFAIKLYRTHERIRGTLVVNGCRFGQKQPGTAVDAGEYPDAINDLLGSLDRADELGLHGMADGDISLHGERRYRQRGGVYAKVLEEDEYCTSPTAPYPFITCEVKGTKNINQ
ncbi:hypothetical protein CEXT_425601 [Caerostris extrusa]|uniref:Uncharacterized protein n=1 Tax=Caerostris extrusa TaxID=172846 RepID=A0AAV4NU53_CAEEX|nr:hypothetical protein CEXT_425601 [Caerostris extrusa]